MKKGTNITEHRVLYKNKNNTDSSWMIAVREASEAPK